MYTEPFLTQQIFSQSKILPPLKVNGKAPGDFSVFKLLLSVCTEGHTCLPL